MKRTFVIAALALALVIASTAYVSAGSYWSPSLYGAYSFVGSRVCVQNKDGLDVNQKLNSDATIRTAHLAGVLRFQRHGMGTITFTRIMEVNHQKVLKGDTPFNVVTVKCDVKHNFWQGTMTLSNCGGKFLEGGGTATDVTVGDIELKVEVSGLGETLLLSDTESNQEDFVGGSPNKRICAQSITAIQRW